MSSLSCKAMQCELGACEACFCYLIHIKPLAYLTLHTHTHNYISRCDCSCWQRRFWGTPLAHLLRVSLIQTCAVPCATFFFSLLFDTIFLHTGRMCNTHTRCQVFTFCGFPLPNSKCEFQFEFFWVAIRV